MFKIPSEAIDKILAAKDDEEIRKILADNGLEAKDEDVTQIKSELDAMPAEGELSVDELEAISGGWRDWLTEGCYSTVEANSWCAYSSDMCLAVYHHYDHEPYPFQKCRNCGCQMGSFGSEQKPGDYAYTDKVKCPRCGAVRWTHEF